MEKRQYVSASTVDTKMEELTNQGIPTSRQEEEVNGNSRKGEPGVSGKEGDYIVGWRWEGNRMYIIGRTCSITTGFWIGRKASVDFESIGVEDRVDAQADLLFTAEVTSAGA
jgi:hypothetical protein